MPILSRKVFGEDLSELIISLYIWFKLSAFRREDREEVQIYGLLVHKFLKHVESRSLTLAPTSLRIVEQFEQRKRMKKANNFQIQKVQPEDVAKLLLDFLPILTWWCL